MGQREFTRGVLCYVTVGWFCGTFRGRRGGTYLGRRVRAEFARADLQWKAPQNIIIISSSGARDQSAGMAPVSVKRVLISESVDPCCKTILQENGIEVTEKPQMTKEELIAEIQVSDSSDSSSAPEYQVPWFESPPS